MSSPRLHAVLTGSRFRRSAAVLGSLLAVSLSLTAATPAQAGAVRAAAGPLARCSVAALSPALGNSHVTVTSATKVTTGTYTPPGSPAPITGLPKFCAVTLTETDSAGNPMHLQIWLPATWNGRFQGVGGGGYACTLGDALPPSFEAVAGSLASAVRAGYSSSTTDCGLTPAQSATGSFALNPDGTLNWPLITDFAKVGIHDAAVEGKAASAAFYGSKPKYSYFLGCSTGGREGLMEAQQYPGDYNGIVSGSPAINWTKFIPSEIWPELVMNQAHDFLPTCKETAFTEAVVKACGGADGVIANPSTCDWNPAQLVGLVTPCGTITRTDAAVVEKIWQGPVTFTGRKLWYGLEPGASFSGLAGTTTSSGGVTTGNPFPIVTSWLGTWLQHNPSWDWHTLTYASFDQLFSQSVREFSNVIATDNPDLASFRKDGGKILIWHGLADQLIFPQGTIDYYQRVQLRMGGAAPTDSFARLFLAPGAQHCASAAGPAPANPLAAVVSWVEHGQAPGSILGTVTDPSTGVVTSSRPLCAYPLSSRYNGSGNPNTAASYHCVRGQPVLPGPLRP